ncbi:SDR family NAD(P)-dependent oxidoreductase, partial [Micromonospora wenchangensis]|uniref:beta-ketoacyl reductase n=1 Tax=Micromonospora wenchangensis TaxID=1185415 RepID=UPI003D764A76
PPEQRSAAADPVDALRYRITWKTSEAPPAVPTGRWLVLVHSSAGEWAEAIEKAMRRSGVDHLVVRCGDDCADLADTLTASPTVQGVLSLLALDDDQHPEFPVLSRGHVSTLALIQAMSDARVRVPLWLTTRGAVGTGAGDIATNATQAAVWGTGRVAGLEHPEFWGGLIDLPEAVDEVAATRVLTALAGVGFEDQLAIRDSGILLRRIIRTARPRQPQRSWKPQGTVLLTGGTGVLGPHLVRWLAEAGAEHVALLSRRGPNAPGTAELTAELDSCGVRLTAVSADMADRTSVAAALDQVNSAGPPIRAVVHAAAHIELGSLAATTVSDFAGVISAKVAGAHHLDELLAGTKLDAFILFSSIAGVWGSGDHAAYAAANAHLDAFAEIRRGRGERAVSIAWGVWRAVNPWDRDRAIDGIDNDQLRARGLPLMEPRLALTALGQVLDDDETALIIADVDWLRFAPVFASARPRPLIEDLPEVRRIAETPVADSGVGGAGDPLREKLATMAAEEGDALVLDMVRRHAAAVLGHDGGDRIEPARPFQAIGFDSLTAVELRTRLSTATGIRLPATLVFDQPTPVELARFLRSRLLPEDTAPGDALATLERSLFGTARPSDREQVADRLRVLVRRWDDLNENGARSGGQAVVDLDAATDEEIFELIDAKLGEVDGGQAHG